MFHMQSFTDQDHVLSYRQAYAAMTSCNVSVCSEKEKNIWRLPAVENGLIYFCGHGEHLGNLMLI